MPVLIVICCVGVNCVACAASGGGTMPRFAASAASGSAGAGKWAHSSYGRRTPPSRERETWILVSLVMREMETARRGRAEDMVSARVKGKG